MSEAVVLHHLTGSNYLQELQESRSAASDVISVTINAERSLRGVTKKTLCSRLQQQHQKRKALKLWKKVQLYICLEELFLENCVKNKACSYCYGNKAYVTALCHNAPGKDF